MTRLRSIAVAVWICLAVVFGAPVTAEPPQPLLVLVSIDGFRWDYVDRVALPTLRTLAGRGVRAEGLIPVFPSVTFPNHYTIVTGLTPDHHGVVGNTMKDPAIGLAPFTMSSATAKDTRWWGGEPIWTTAIRQGLKSAAMFWPGSEAILPTYWRPYDDALPHVNRVRQVLEWMSLPEGERPAFSTLYFSDVDKAGHDFGPDSREVIDAMVRVDAAIGDLVSGMEALGLGDRTTYVIVSDHGMAATSNDRLVFLDDYLDLDDIDVVEWSPNVTINPRPGTTADAVYRRLADRHPALAVYTREQMPPWLRFGAHPRIPAIVGMAEPGWTVTTHAAARDRRETARGFTGGAHGYDPRYRDMHGLFIAAGPRLRRGLVTPALENIHVYTLMCELLGIRPAPNDGDPAEIARFTHRSR